MRRLLLSVLAGTVLCSTASALYVDTLHEFSGGTTDGGRPQGALTRDGTKLYGMTSQYCAAGWGGVFTMSTDGTGFTILHDFAISATNGRTPGCQR